MTFFETKLSNLTMNDSSHEFSLGLPKVTIETTQQELVNFKIEANSTNITISDYNPFIQFTMQNIQLEFSMKYKMFSQPEWIHDEGNS